MKLRAASKDALCPVCALDGAIMPLQMVINSLTIACPKGHWFDTISLSELASLLNDFIRKPLD